MQWVFGRKCVLVPPGCISRNRWSAYLLFFADALFLAFAICVSPLFSQLCCWSTILFLGNASNRPVFIYADCPGKRKKRFDDSIVPIIVRVIEIVVVIPIFIFPIFHWHHLFHGFYLEGRPQQEIPKTPSRRYNYVDILRKQNAISC